MYQFYFLVIVLNLLAGTALAFDSLDQRVRVSTFFNPELFQRAKFRFGLGVATFVAAFFKLWSVTHGDWYILGDFFPAIAGLVAGFTLMLEYYRDRRGEETRALQRLDRLFLAPRSVYGGISILSAILHFLLHSVLFL